MILSMKNKMKWRVLEQLEVSFLLGRLHLIIVFVGLNNHNDFS